MDVAADYEALRGSCGAVRLRRDFVRVHGPDAVAWLQGQLSQDVTALAQGGSAWSFLLEPQGKVDALLRATRTGSEEMVLDVDGGWAGTVKARLERFKLRTKAEIEELDWECVAVRGPAAASAAGDAGEGVLVVEAGWPGLPGVDLLGEAPSVPDGVRECSAEAWEVVRIEAGIPVMGSELTERTIPAEAGIVDLAVSFTKGCYTGQELVARIDSRGGHVPRRLRGVLVDPGAAPPAGAVLLEGDREVGSLTSVAVSPRREAAVALAYVRREVTPPADVEVRWDGGSARATVRELPLVA